MFRPKPVISFFFGSESVPVLESFSRVYPICGSISNMIPSVPLVRPPSGEMRYFAIHGYRRLIIGGSTLREACCAGEFCDRQSPTGYSIAEPGYSCGCLSNSLGRGSEHCYVTDHAVKFACDKNISANGFVVVPNFRSRHFDKILFQETCYTVFNQQEPGDKPCNWAIREQVETVVSHINSNRGWTVIGWVRSSGLSLSSGNVPNPSPCDLKLVFVGPTHSDDCEESMRLSGDRLLSRIIYNQREEARARDLV